MARAAAPGPEELDVLGDSAGDGEGDATVTASAGRCAGAEAGEREGVPSRTALGGVAVGFAGSGGATARGVDVALGATDGWAAEVAGALGAGATVGVADAAAA